MAALLFLASLPFAISSPLLVERASASAVCTNYNLTYKLTSIAAPVQGPGTIPSGSQLFKISVDDSSNGYKQTINGFGAAVTDATVVTFNSLSSNSLSTLLSTLVTSSGANFNLMRHTIGSSDMTADGGAYSYDDTANNAPDTSLSKFALGTNGTAMAVSRSFSFTCSQRR